MNPPHSALVHLGCAACVLTAAICGVLASGFPELQNWLQQHPYAAPLLYLILLAAAYLLEHALTTAAILTLLASAALCAGFSMAITGNPATVWQLTAGPLCYFAAAALVLHRWAEKLYRWQQGTIFTIAGLAGTGATCILTGAHPILTLCALFITANVATFVLIAFFSREYFEITSDSRTRSTVTAMVLLTAMPTCRIIWHLLRGSYYGLGGLLRFVFQCSRWG